MSTKNPRGWLKKQWIRDGDGSVWVDKYLNSECTKKQYAQAYARYYWAHPDVKSRQKVLLDIPQVKQLHAAHVTRYNNKPEVKSRRSIAAKKRNAMPEFKTIAWARHLKRKYGMSLDDHAAMLASQNSSCAICDAPPPTNRKLNVDHDHETGKVRALLCHPCNTLIGYSRENVVVLQRAILYLNKHKTVAQ